MPVVMVAEDDKPIQCWSGDVVVVFVPLRITEMDAVEDQIHQFRLVLNLDGRLLAS